MLELIAQLVVPNETKIVLVSLDGLAGMPRPETGLSELETARLPHLSDLAAGAACGLLRHVGSGITPGSVPGHLGLFGYDPVRFQAGRGVVEALGVDFDLQPGDVAGRGNFCTTDASGVVTDRRAGRITTDVCRRLVDRLRSIRLTGVDVYVEPLTGHRFVLILRGEGLSGRLSDTDPQRRGAQAHPVRALDGEAERTATLVNTFIAEARSVLGDEPVANMVLFRGFDSRRPLPSFPQVFGLRAAGIARYTLAGLARLVGMDVLKPGDSFADQVVSLRDDWDAYDFFFLHYEDTDKPGEDGDFDRKVQALERLDAFIPTIRALEPDVLVVTGDHATPSVLRAHGWQRVPVLLSSPYSAGDPVTAFTERACVAGTLGMLPAQELMPLAMAHARRLTKFGA